MTDHTTTAEDRERRLANIRENVARAEASPVPAVALPNYHALRIVLSELEAAQARLDKARSLHKPQRRYLDSAREGETSFDFANDAAEFYETAIGNVSFFEVCAHCGDLEMYDLEERRDYRDSLWPCKTARALGLGEGANDA